MELLAVLASGRGTDFQSIIDHIKLGVLQNVKPVLLICNNKEAQAIERAKDSGVKTEYIEGIVGKKFPDKDSRKKARENFDKTVTNLLNQYNVTLIALAGFNQIVSKLLIDHYRMRIINIHPAYDTQKYGGVGMVGEKVHEAVITNKEKNSGCTVHYVDYTVDLGPVILRQRVSVKETDTVKSLADRILVWEHRTYSKAMQLHIDKEVQRRRSFSEEDILKDPWERSWNERQKAYIDYQRNHSLEMYGKHLEEIL
jgi:phosphoribosylglycinamide formyltransferase-1